MKTKETKQPKKQNARIMELTPNWQSFFELSKQIVTAQIPEDAGRSVVLEMLDYGKRMDAGTNAERAQRTRRNRERQEKGGEA